MIAPDRIEQELNRLVPARLQARWGDVKEGLWFLPACGTIVCAILAFALVKLDSSLTLSDRFASNSLFFGAGAEGARGVLTAIAASIVTVTGTIFSIVIVALQLASGQFTPRVMRHFTGDRVNQVVLALMIGTFTYCMLVLRTVRSQDDVPGPFVPVISVSFAIVLSLVCIGGLIWFIHHSARQLQVSFILERASGDTLRLIDQTFPMDVEAPGPAANHAPPSEAHTEVIAKRSGYIQDIDLDHLMALSRARDIRIHVLHPCGAWILSGMPIARVWRESGAVTEDDLTAVRDNLVLGVERTLQHDVTFGIRQIADIAVKAVSPAINDPTTATQTIDQLNNLLVRAGNRPAQQSAVMVGDRPAIFLETVTFAMLADTAYTQIRHYGASDVVVVSHLIDGMRRVTGLVPEEYRAVMVDHSRLALNKALAQNLLEVEKDALRTIGAWTEGAVAHSASARIDPVILTAI